MAEGTDADKPAIALLILCGIPASGKTTLAWKLSEHCYLAETSEVITVSYDSILDQSLETQVGESHQHLMLHDRQTNQAVSWKDYRQDIVSCIDLLINQILHVHFSKQEVSIIYPHIWKKFSKLINLSLPSASDCKRYVIIIDDNMYYQGMRYAYYQLAKKHRVGYCVVNINCSVEEALARNKHRDCQVSDCVIKGMANKFELPNPKKNYWEQNTVTVGDTSDNSLRLVTDLVMIALSSPVINEDNCDTEEAEMSRLTNLTNLLHQSDQILRKLISERIMKCKSTAMVHKSKLAAEAKNMNKRRQDLLEQIRCRRSEFPCATIIEFGIQSHDISAEMALEQLKTHLTYLFDNMV